MLRASSGQEFKQYGKFFLGNVLTVYHVGTPGIPNFGKYYGYLGFLRLSRVGSGAPRITLGSRPRSISNIPICCYLQDFGTSGVPELKRCAR